jgi:nucleoside 2-deoxyribosyltransferase
VQHSPCVERADQWIRTISLHEKIFSRNKDADIIIADLTEKNSNVLYELGLAVALKKPVIPLTRDPIKDIPLDIKHLEFIKYKPLRDVELINKLNNAIGCLIKDLKQQKWLIKE